MDIPRGSPFMKTFNTAYIRPTKAEDFVELEKNLRHADRLEFENCNYNGLDFVSTMTMSLLTTPMNTCVTNDGQIVFVIGLNKIRHIKVPGVPFDKRRGAFVWLLGTHLIEERMFEFGKHTQGVFDEIKKEYDYLATHALAIEPKRNRWLKWMGFKEINRTEARGKLQLPFIDYETD